MRLMFASIALASLLAPSAFAADNYELDPVHSSATFSVNHLGIGNVHGRFNAISGTYVLDGAKSKIKIEIPTDSIDTNAETRDQHLRSPDFFDAKQFPKMTFESTKMVPTAKGLKIDGKLTLKGRTKAISVVATKVGEGKDPWGGFRTGYEATFTIKRTDFGIDFMPGGVGEDVVVTIALEGIKK